MLQGIRKCTGYRNEVDRPVVFCAETMINITNTLVLLALPSQKVSEVTPFRPLPKIVQFFILENTLQLKSSII